MKNKQLMSGYYNLPAWIIREFGFTREMGAYLIIYNFCRQGKQCYYSKAQWAQLLNCTQMQAIRILKALEAENYIISERRKSAAGNNCLSTAYRINEETAQELQDGEPSNMDVTTPSNMDVTTPSNMDVTTPSNMDVTTPSNMDVTTPSNMDVTQSEYINQNNNQSSKSERERPRNSQKEFTPPTVEDVAAYCAERQNGIDAHRFIDYYTANGWTQGKGTPIKDWKAVVRTWEHREDKKNAAQQPSTQQKPNRSSIDLSDVAKLINQF